MTKITYNMLVRDDYPSILERNGKKKCVTEVISENEFLDALVDKLEEEVGSFAREYDDENDEKALNKLADVMDVVANIVRGFDLSDDAFQRIRDARHAMYGGYSKRLKLLTVEDASE